MMDIQDLHSAFPLSSTCSSSSSSSIFNLHPLSIGAERWQVGEKTTQQILYIIQPTADSENRRKEIIEYIQALIEDSFGIKVYPFGSVPLKTYLPHGDVDLTAVSHGGTSHDLAEEILNLLQNEEKTNTRFQVRDALCVPAQVRVVKCTVDDISVDISFNQTTGLCALYFLEQVDQFIGKDHLFKRSVILIKAWCYYESRLLGGFHGLISTYALETMVLHVINHYHCSLHCPLAILYKFLEYYSTFDWESCCIGINGLILISSLPQIVVQPPHDCDELLLTDNFVRSYKEAFSSSTGDPLTRRPAFPVKFLNIWDPLRDDNNLGRSVSKGNFYRIRSALAYGTQKLVDILMLPPEKIRKGLEKFFVNTLERNGRGRRVDVLVPVPTYGARSSEVFAAHEVGDSLLAGIQYGLWFHDYGMLYPIQLNTSATRQLWNNGWMTQNMQPDQDVYYHLDESPPSSVGSATGLRLANKASVEEKGKSRGTEPYIPDIEHLLQRDMGFEESRNQEERQKEVETSDSQAWTPREENRVSDVAGSSCVLSFSMEEFPLLPGSKPMPIKVSPPESPDCAKVKETVASSDSLEVEAFKLSPRSGMLSEVGKQSDSDVSVVLDLPSDPTVTVEEDRESPKSEEKSVVPLQPLQLTNETEFPPLSRPAKPEIRLDKKEFPPLRACLRPEKRSKWKKNFKDTRK